MSRTDVEIVEFSPDLARAFHDLNVEWLEKYFRVETIDHEMLSRPEEQIIQHGGVILFAKCSGEIVGTVALKHHGDGVYELTKMAVTERFRGAGIGRHLMRACIEKYEEISGTALFLESHSSLTPALTLYESAGFEHAPRPAPSEYQRADVYMVYQRP
ncbi:MAG: GNAT family N-acetyltransferase [Gammaproteobacteria bacterium]|nr:GNAT family N-acetyltransferase [Gammaproteobacteria bacterium]